MKKPRIVNAMEYIDEDIITEAVAYRPKKKRIPVWTKWALEAACICICVLGVFTAMHPGMGCTNLHYPVSYGDEVYYSENNMKAYHWNPSMEKPENLGMKGRFFRTEEGPVLYSDEDEMLFLADEQGLLPIGKTQITEYLDSPVLIGIHEDYAYWVGQLLKLPEDGYGMGIMRTNRTGGTAESLLTVEDGGILAYTLRDDRLYYQIYIGNKKNQELRVLDVVSKKDTLLAELPLDEASGMAPRSHFMEDCVVIADMCSNRLWKMAYEGGEPELLAEVAPYNAAMAEKNGKIYFAASFGEKESEELLSGNGYYSEEFVSVDLEDGELDRNLGFELDNGDGTVRYTIIELAMANNGFYFTEPQKGLYYHSFADGTNTRIP